MRRATHCRLRSFLSGAFLLLLVLLCSAPRIARASTNATPPCWGSATTTSDDTVAPAVHAALAAIADLATRARAASNVPGVSIAVLHADRVIYAGGFGCANIAADHVATAHSIDRAGSITKLFTDTMLMQLRDAGLLEL